MKPTRAHITVIVERLFKSVRNLILIAFFYFVSQGFNVAGGRQSFQDLPGIGLLGNYMSFVAIALIILSFILLFSAIMNVLAWYMKTLSVEDDQLILRYGIVTRKQVTVPFDKINTIEIERSVIQRILGTCRLRVDSGVVKHDGAKPSEIEMVFKLNYAKQLRAYFWSLSQGEKAPTSSDDQVTSFSFSPESDDVSKRLSEFVDQAKDAIAPGVYRSRSDGRLSYYAGYRELFLYAVTGGGTTSFFAILFGFLFTVYGLLGQQIVGWLEGFFLESVELITNLSVAVIVILIILFLLFYFIINTILNSIIAVSRYYQFAAKRHDKHIVVEHGLLRKRSYNVPVKNIHAVIIKQSIIRRIFGYCSVEVETIGYGDGKDEIALLFPIIKYRELDTLMRSVLPEYGYEGQLHTPPKAGRRRYFFVPTLVTVIPFAIAAIFWRPAALILIPVLLALWLICLLSYKNASLSFNDQMIQASHGAFMRKIYRIRMTDLQQMQLTSHIIMERAKLRHYTMYYHAPSLSFGVTVRFLSDEHEEGLKRYLDAI